VPESPVYALIAASSIDYWILGRNASRVTGSRDA
jgi:hypothetical protein